MRVQLTASLRAVAPSTSVQRSPASRPGVAYRAAATAPMRTVCSASWLATLGPTRRRARKNPRSTADTAIHGRPSADSRSAPAARTSPSHHLAASPARARLCRHGQHPQPGPQRQQTPQHAPADAASRLSSSVSRRVAGHRDARRSQRDEQPVHRQHQLVQAHALAAQRVGQPDAQPQPRQTQHYVRPGEQGRVLPVVWPVFLPHAHPSRRFSALLPAYAAPAQNMSGGMGCFAALFMV